MGDFAFLLSAAIVGTCVLVMYKLTVAFLEALE